MRELLQRAGFSVHGQRADCTHCAGSSRLTVSFTSEVAFCHRCHWKANVRQLARALGQPVAPETAEHRAARARAEQFERWLDSRRRELSGQYRALGQKATLAKGVLLHFPDCAPAWDALARFYHAEARLGGALDALSFEKVSPWLDAPVTPLELFVDWERANVSAA